MRTTPTPTREELEEAVKLTETMAQQSERYARRDAGHKRGALVARARATDAKTALATFRATTKPIDVPPPIEDLLAYDNLAGEIANISFLFRCGEASEATQRAISIKLACLARDVRKLERFVQEACDKADDQPEGVPYNGRPDHV